MDERVQLIHKIKNKLSSIKTIITELKFKSPEERGSFVTTHMKNLELSILKVEKYINEIAAVNSSPGVFTREEFIGAYTVENLCKAITAASCSLSLTSSGNTIAWLNEFLGSADLYAQLPGRGEKKEHPDVPSAASLIMINRLLLERLLPQVTPKYWPSVTL